MSWNSRRVVRFDAFGPEMLTDLSDLADELADLGINEDFLELGKLGTDTQYWIPWMQATYIMVARNEGMTKTYNRFRDSTCLTPASRRVTSVRCRRGRSSSCCTTTARASRGGSDNRTSGPSRA